MTKWMQVGADGGVVIATLASILIRELNRKQSGEYDNFDFTMGQLREALDEYYAAKPHLSPSHETAAVTS